VGGLWLVAGLWFLPRCLQGGREERAAAAPPVMHGWLSSSTGSVRLACARAASFCLHLSAPLASLQAGSQRGGRFFFLRSCAQSRLRPELLL
jgi:hypothetical protein